MRIGVTLLSLLTAGSVSIGAEVPRPAPEFVINTVSGQQLLLSQYRGKVVAVEFLLTTCPHCQAMSRLMSRLREEYGSKGFQPLGVAFNDQALLLLKDFIRSNQVDYPVGVATRDAVFGFLQLSPIVRTSVPLLVFIDRRGIIRAQYAGDDPFFSDEEKNVRATLETLLAERSSPNRAGRARPTPRKTGEAGVANR